MSDSNLSEMTLQEKFDELYLDSKQEKHFRHLMKIILSEENILGMLNK